MPVFRWCSVWKSWRQPGEQILPEGASRRARNRGGRLDSGQRHAPVPQDFQRVAGQYDRSRRNRRYPRHILQRLAVYVEKEVKLKAAVKSALIYPIAVVGVAIIVVGALMIFVVPIFANMFAAMGVELPLPTKIVVGFSGFLGTLAGCSWSWVWAASLPGRQVYGTPGGRMAIDSIMLKLPIFGILIRKIAVARFTRTLGTLITSGVPLLESLSITARTSGNAVIEQAILKVRKAVEEGRNLTDPLRETEIFPNMVTQMIGVGEQTGAMDSMLQKIADFYEDEVDAAVKDMLTLLEPVIIAFLGGTVGGVVIALYMPMFKLIGQLAG